MSARHQVILSFDDGTYAKLICPDSGCGPATSCHECGREVDGPSEDGCYDCKDGFGDECWVKGWFDNCTADELLTGALTVEVEPRFDNDTPTFHILGTVDGESRNQEATS